MSEQVGSAETARRRLSGEERTPRREPIVPKGYAPKASCRKCYGRGYQFTGVRCSCVKRTD